MHVWKWPNVRQVPNECLICNLFEIKFVHSFILKTSHPVCREITNINCESYSENLSKNKETNLWLYLYLLISE